MQIRNIGIYAHVDAGKTTLTEQLLKISGAIRTPGSVDQGTAHTDRMAIERRRGISIQATCAPMQWRDCTIQLIDTPGHADFMAEVERSMWSLDGAVLVLSAAEGVQPQSEVLFRALKARGIPTLIFLNKTDRPGADAEAALASARKALSPAVFPLSDAEAAHALVAETDDAALADYLEGNLYPASRLLPLLRLRVQRGEAYPALAGSALRGTGVRELLDAVVDLLPPPPGDAQAPLSGVVFAISDEDAMGRAATVRLFSGTLKNRDTVQLPDASGRMQAHKVAQIRALSAEGRGRDIGELRAGEIGSVLGLGGVRVGQVLGDPALLPRSVRPGELCEPLLLTKVTPRDPTQKTALQQALRLLGARDVLLTAEELAGEMHVRVMGAVQLEVLGEQLKEEFGLDVLFGEPNVIYRETIAESATGFFAYTMPKPCWAVIEFFIEPLPRGSGVLFESAVPARDILPRYQNQVRQAIPSATRQGMLGWQVDDVKITLVGGSHHLIHTHPLDFIVATPVAFLDGLRRGGSVLLEPILEILLTVPEEFAGKLLSEISLMRGETLDSHAEDGRAVLSARVPLKECVHFSTRLSAMTSGRGAMSSRLCGYRECDLALGAACPRRGVHPLDTAKYILATRSALDGDIYA